MLWISCLLTASLFLLLLPCSSGQKGGQNEQSTDIISVWEGDSVSITCSMQESLIVSHSENEVGMYLSAIIRNFHVIYVSKQNKSRIYPPLANRTEYSKDGRNLRVTLHNVQQSDSNIYICTKYIACKECHKMLMGKTTIVLVKVKTSEDVEQDPLYVNPQQGQSISITCEWKSSHEAERIYLLKTLAQREIVFDFDVSSQNASIHSAFAHRLEYAKDIKKIVITLHKLQKHDSDIYVCAGMMKKFPFLLANGNGTMMLIKEMEQTDCSSSSWVIYGLIIMVVLLFSALIYCTLYCIDMKKYFQKRKRNTIYEDMSFSSRRSTLVRTNTYSTSN